MFEQIEAGEVEGVNAAMSESSATTPRSFQQSNMGVNATIPDASMDRTTARGTSGPPSFVSEASPDIVLPDPNPDNLSTIIVPRADTTIPTTVDWDTHWGQQASAEQYLRGRSIDTETLESPHRCTLLLLMEHRPSDIQAERNLEHIGCSDFQ